MINPDKRSTARMNRIDPSPAQHRASRLPPIGAARLVAFAALIFALAWGGVIVSRGGGTIATLWLPDAVLAAVVFRVGWRDARYWVAAAFVGYWLADAMAGGPPQRAPFLAAIHCAEAVGACWLLLRAQKRPPDMYRFADLARFAWWCCVVAPAVAGFAAALLMTPPASWINATMWRIWFLADGLGMLMTCPVVLIAIDAWRTRSRIGRRRAGEIALILAGNAAAAMLVFGQSQYPLLFLGLPMVFVAAFRLGVTGTAAAISVVAVIATVLTLAGSGPTYLIDGSLGTRIHVLQLFLATAFATGLPFASALSARDETREELRRSRDFSDTLVSTMQETVFRADAHGRWIFLNPAWATLTGYSVAESLGWDALRLLPPEDRAAAVQRRAGIVSGVETEATVQQRFFHASGECRHVEVTLRRLAGDDGSFAGTIGTIRDITAQVDTQRALADSEARFRQLAETAPVGIFRAGPDGMLNYANTAWTAKIGLSVEETLGHGWMRSVIDPEQYVIEPPWQNFYPGEVRIRDMAFRRSDGGELWVQAVNSAEFDAQGKITGFIGVIVDITEQRRARIALAESKRLFEVLADLSPAGIFRTNCAGEVTYVNQAWMTFAGLTYGEALGFGWASAIHPDDLPEVSERWVAAMQGTGEMRAEFRFLGDGRERWVEVITTSEHDETGARVGFLGVNIDISERKAAEAALAEGKEQLRLLAENATDAVFRLTLEGICLYASPSVADMIGLPPRYLIGHDMLSRIHPDDAAAAIAAHRALGAGEIERCVTTYRSERIRHPGEWMWLEANSGLVRDPVTNAPLEIISSVRDITDRKTLELELDAARRHAEVSAQAKSSFLANMSHEIRTPMNGVLGFTELLLAEEPRPDQQQKLQMIADSGAAMMRLLNDILDLSKIEAGHVTLAQDRVDLRHLARSCAKLVTPLAIRAGLELRVEVADEVPAVVIGDGLRLRQIILNLLGNAVKFTERGSIVLSVVATAEQLAISVGDTGVGIAAERQGAIFQEFVQERASTERTYGGTGLGLAISLELAKLMEGDLSLSSAVGVGTTVTLHVPRHDIVDDDPAVAFAPLPVLPAVTGARVLVAEDNKVNQLLIKAMLTRLGYEPEIACDGTEAIAMVQASFAEQKRFGLVLMDMQMPEIDGLAATAQIRASGITPDRLPIVALTANAYASDVEACQAAGMQDHLAKPVQMATLDRIVRLWAIPPHATPNPAPIAAPVPASADPELLAQFDARVQQIFALLDAALLDPAGVAAFREALHLLAGTAMFFGKTALGTVASDLDERLGGGSAVATRAFLHAARSDLARAAAETE